MPRPNLSRSVSRIREASATLNKLTDDAAATVAEVEKFLGECSIGVNALVEIAADEFGRYWGIGYRRVGGRFRIAIVSGDYCGPEGEASEDIKAWSDCSRDAKLESIQHLPDLIAAIAKQVEESVNEAKSATDVAKNVLNSLKEGIDG